MYHPRGTRLGNAAKNNVNPTIPPAFFNGAGAGGDATITDFLSGGTFAVAQPDFSYSDGSPFSSPGLATGTSTVTSNSSTGLDAPFGVLSGVPTLSGQPQNPTAAPIAKGCGAGCHAQQATDAWIYYGKIMAAVVVVLIGGYFIVKAKKKG